VLALIAGCVAAIGVQAALSLLCAEVPFCEINGPVLVAFVFLACALFVYLALKRASSSENSKDVRKIMAADTATDGGEFGEGGGGDGD
jgi:hypothetical protein